MPVTAGLFNFRFISFFSYGVRHPMSNRFTKQVKMIDKIFSQNKG